MNKEDFILELSKININVTKEQLNKLDIYYNFLIEYNFHTNLTTIIEENSVFLKHFYDSLTILKAINLNDYENLLDIGSGAGFPGMVLKIFFPHLNITLLDSNGKKIIFLKELANKLNFSNQDLLIIYARSEEYIKDQRESFDIVTSRGVADLKILLELSLPFTKIGGLVIPLKGNINEELDLATKAIEILGGNLINVINFKLPIENSNRNLPVIKKIKSTPIKYPRSYNIIIKKPLK